MPEFEYMPVSYQTGTYDQKWIEKLCVRTTHSELSWLRCTLAQNTCRRTLRLRRSLTIFFQPPNTPITGNKERDIPSCCTGVVEANFNIIGVAHIGRISRDPKWMLRDITTSGTGALRTWLVSSPSRSSSSYGATAPAVPLCWLAAMRMNRV